MFHLTNTQDLIYNLIFKQDQFPSRRPFVLLFSILWFSDGLTIDSGALYVEYRSETYIWERKRAMCTIHPYGINLNLVHIFVSKIIEINTPIVDGRVKYTMFYVSWKCYLYFPFSRLLPIYALPEMKFNISATLYCQIVRVLHMHRTIHILKKSIKRNWSEQLRLILTEFVNNT